MAHLRNDWCSGIIDLSDNQSQHINLQACLTDGIVAVVHKAPEGNWHKDPFFDDRRNAARQAGLLWGAYHYGRGIRATGIEQADWFLSGARPAADELVAFDCEADCPLQVMEEFVGRIQAVLNRLPMIYGRNRLAAVLTGHPDSVVFRCPLWFDDYPAPPATMPTRNVPSGWTDWTLWQFSSKTNGPEPHGVASISDDIDRSVFKGSPAQLKAAWPLAPVVSPLTA